MMSWMKKSIFTIMVLCFSLSQTVYASEEISKSSMGNALNVYLEAFYSAVATLLVMVVLWAIIFRPKIKRSTE